MNLLNQKELKKIKLKVVDSAGGCKYHPKIGQQIGLARSIPSGMCPYAYVVAYPYALSLLYDAVFSWRRKIDKNSVIAQCCHPDNQMAIKIKRVNNPRINKKLLNKYEEERYKIFIELISKRNGASDCSDCFGFAGMKVGNVFEFNRGNLPEICPAAFNQLFPLLADFVSSKKKNMRFACPDPKTNVIFEVEKK